MHTLLDLLNHLYNIKHMHSLTSFSLVTTNFLTFEIIKRQKQTLSHKSLLHILLQAIMF